MATGVETRMTVDDLMAFDGRAELINGRIVELMASGDLPVDVMMNIHDDLRAHAKRIGRGIVKPDGQGYVVPELPSGRVSFQPDVSYYVGPRPVNRMRFIVGCSIFATEVRSENDYGPAAERDMADKRADYFTAGTLVVWDVDPVNELIHVYRTSQPTSPTTYRKGEVAGAEPAVPGWRMPVDDVFAAR
jgi:hypothetical protein